MLNSHMLLVTHLLCFSQNKNIFAVPSNSLLHLCYTSSSGLYFLLAFLWCCHHSNQKLSKHFLKKGQWLCSYGVYENWTASSALRSWVSIQIRMGRRSPQPWWSREGVGCFCRQAAVSHCFQGSDTMWIIHPAGRLLQAWASRTMCVTHRKFGSGLRLHWGVPSIPLYIGVLEGKLQVRVEMGKDAFLYKRCPYIWDTYIYIYIYVIYVHYFYYCKKKLCLEQWVEQLFYVNIKIPSY